MGETTPLKELNEQAVTDCKTPPLPNQNKTENHHQNSSSSGSCKCKPSVTMTVGLGTPDRLKLPKPFKYPERYTSPTDHIMSPISKGLLARSRRGGALLPPSKIQSKIHELRSSEIGQIQLKVDQ